MVVRSTVIQSRQIANDSLRLVYRDWSVLESSVVVETIGVSSLCQECLCSIGVVGVGQHVGCRRGCRVEEPPEAARRGCQDLRQALTINRMLLALRLRALLTGSLLLFKIM